MLRLVTLILAGALICIGALVSVVKVASLQQQEDREVVLNAQLLSLKKEPQTPQTNEKIVDTYLQLRKLSEAMTILQERWKFLAAHWKTADHAEFCRVAAKLAAVYADRGNFDHALDVEDIRLQYDKRLHGENSPEVARDFNNQALCLYLKGTTMTEPRDRKMYFRSAIKALETSNSIWKELKSDRSDFNIANNKKLEQLARRDLVSSRLN
ncbi:MAG: hypothetical protein C0507_22950 [Cyanobacteria bacterium PR.3.49]|nr:hypothetical protein [Cyanobacteria bacterium PR.3.49]